MWGSVTLRYDILDLDQVCVVFLMYYKAIKILLLIPISLLTHAVKPSALYESVGHLGLSAHV